MLYGLEPLSITIMH